MNGLFHLTSFYQPRLSHQFRGLRLNEKKKKGSVRGQRRAPKSNERLSPTPVFRLSDLNQSINQSIDRSIDRSIAVYLRKFSRLLERVCFHLFICGKIEASYTTLKTMKIKSFLLELTTKSPLEFN